MINFEPNVSIIDYVILALIIVISILGIVWLILDWKRSSTQKKIDHQIVSNNVVQSSNNRVTGETYSIKGQLSNSEKQQIIDNPQWDKIMITRNVEPYHNTHDLIDHLKRLLDYDMSELNLRFDSYAVTDYYTNTNQPKTINLYYVYC